MSIRAKRYSQHYSLLQPYNATVRSISQSLPHSAVYRLVCCGKKIVLQVLFFGVRPRLSASSRIAHLLPEEQVYLNQQSGTIRLDCFTHCLIVKCAPDITVSIIRRRLL